MKALQTLVKRNRERVYLDGEQKAELLEQYGHRCAACGAASSQLEWDHVARVSDSFGAQQFQPLCTACHKEKTSTELKAAPEDVRVVSRDLLSREVLSLWEAVHSGWNSCAPNESDTRAT